MQNRPLPALALLWAALVTALVAAPAGADHKLILESHQDAFEVQGQQQPAQDKTVTMWVGEDGVARDDGQSLVLIQGDTLYLVNHENESYNALDLPVDVVEMVPEAQRDQVRQMKQMARLEATVTPTDEMKVINGWNSRRYDVVLANETGLGLDMVIWASDDVDVDPAANRELVAALASLQPGGAEWVKATTVIGGFPVLRETTMKLPGGNTVTTTEELVSVEEMEAPEGTYAPPAGYEQVEFGPGGPAVAP